MQIVKQTGKYDCGVAALAMIAGIGYDSATQIIARDPNLPIVLTEKQEPLFQLNKDAEGRYYLGISEMEMAWAMHSMTINNFMLINPNTRDIKDTWFGVACHENMMALPTQAQVLRMLDTRAGVAVMPSYTDDLQHHWMAFHKGLAYDSRPGFDDTRPVQLIQNEWQNGHCQSVIFTEPGYMDIEVGI